MERPLDRSDPLSYATPALTRRRRPVNIPIALAGGIFLVIVGSVMLLVGVFLYAQFQSGLSRDAAVALLSSIMTFSALCLVAGLPLIYRAARGNDE